MALKQIKTPYSSMLGSEENSFDREIDALKKIQHPCVSKYVESFVENNFAYIVTEYANGGSLDSMLDSL